ncbi:MAG: hypothetical protein L6R35_004924, partial [Caloplaca aegaea]
MHANTILLVLLASLGLISAVSLTTINAPVKREIDFAPIVKRASTKTSSGSSSSGGGGEEEEVEEEEDTSAGSTMRVEGGERMVWVAG